MTDSFDALVIGGGVAGLRAALELADEGWRTAVLTKSAPADSTSGWAKGGIAVELGGEEESLVLHAEDTLAAGAGLCDPDAVSLLVREGREEVLRLIDWGARFDQDGRAYHLTREAAHSHPRILHAGGDATGREIVRALVSRLKGSRKITHLAGFFVSDLFVADGEIHGVRGIDAAGDLRAFASSNVVLATGGIGQCWPVTSSPADATGDGVSLALRAGCTVSDMEFVQFHPTALAIPGDRAWLLTEALRGEGAVIVDAQGRRFLFERDPRGELAPRDVVAREIARRIADSHDGTPAVFLDLRPIPGERLSERFPGVMGLCLERGLDPRKEIIPITPAAHYAMGGVHTDHDGRTEVQGLVAAGEVACVGVHGANRLASNSLLEGLVFGARAARTLIRRGKGRERSSLPEAAWPRLPPREHLPAALAEIHHWAEEGLSVLRSGRGLEEVKARLEQRSEQLLRPGDPLAGVGGLERGFRERFEYLSRVLVLRAVADSALWRRESRGAHFRDDYPQQNDREFRKHSSFRLDLK